MADLRRNPLARKKVLMFALCVGVSVTYAQNRKQQREVQITPEPAQTLSAGGYYALVIGNNNYQFPINKLHTAVNDATAVAKLLQQSYGFKPPKVLVDATRAQILTALYEYRHTLPKNSNLLIYYAGHGVKDPGNDKVYWLPVDARNDNDLNWISASTIIEEIKALPSAHVLVISDSCFSGDLTRAVPVKQEIDESVQHGTYLRKMIESPSRTLMSSGRDEPVADGGSGGHSKFAYVLLESLQHIDQNEFTAGYLFQTRIQSWVTGTSDQVPQYTVIPNSGHAFGDFVFSRGGGSAFNGDLTHILPDIACALSQTLPGVGPRIRPGDTVPCDKLDQPLRWTTQFELSKPPQQTKGTARLTIMVGEDGHVRNIRPRGETSLQDIDSWLKAAAQSWQTNPPTYKGMPVKSSFALDLDFGQ